MKSSPANCDGIAARIALPDARSEGRETLEDDAGEITLDDVAEKAPEVLLSLLHSVEADAICFAAEPAWPLTAHKKS